MLIYTAITEAVHVPDANVVDVSRAAGHSLKTAEGYIRTADDRLDNAVTGLGQLVTNYSPQKITSTKQERNYLKT